MFKTVVFRTLWPTIVAALAACLYCVAVDPETIAFGLLVVLFVLPSALLFVLLETIRCNRLKQYAGFMLPIIVVVLICLSTIASATPGMLADGGDDMIVYFLNCYGVASAAALAWLCGRQFCTKQ